MKTIVKNDNNVSIYLFEDSEVVTIKSDCIEVGNPLRLIISDCNSENATLVEGVNAPEEWFGHKYLFADGEWSLNPGWKSPEEIEAELNVRA